MHSILSKSKVFIEDLDISTLDTVRWSMRMIEFLPIPGKSYDNTMRISATDTASLSEEFSWLDEDLENQ